MEQLEEEDMDNTILTVSEIIDKAFGDPEVNIVHHKQVQIVLYLLARQLRILERQVSVKLTPSQTAQKSSSTLSVTEVKLQTITSKNTKDTGPGRRRDAKKSDKASKSKGEKASTEATLLTSSKSVTADKPLTKKTDKDITVEISADLGSNVEKSLTVDSGLEKTSSTGKTSLTNKPSTVGKTSTGEEPSTSKKTTFTDKGLTEKVKKTSAKSRTDETTVERKNRSEKSSDKQTTREMDPQDYQKLLDEVEEMRERELRVIHQRANSRDQRDKTPTPIASMDSVEATYEKLLVVERVPAEEAAARAAREKSGRVGQLPRVSVVTLEQFQALAFVVQELKKKLDPVGALDFPENAELMQELRKGASLTDAMAALQLSARLEATEKTLKSLLSLVTDMANQMPGFKPTAAANANNIEVLFGRQNQGQDKVQRKKNKGEKRGIGMTEDNTFTGISVSPVESGTSILLPLAVGALNGDHRDEDAVVNIITLTEIEKKLDEVNDDILKQVTNITNRNTASAEAALKLVTKLEQKIESSLNLGTRMDELENLIAKYAEQINILDTGLSSQLTNYQEELTQMQHDLETALENMGEVLANTGGDATAVAELNAHFNELQLDINDKVLKQNELRDIQHYLSMDLDGLRTEIEMLRDTKSDRDEVTDALRDKAGLGDLNGLVSLQQFDAVTGDIEKHLASAYDKFNNQETVWQKFIDDLRREFSEKADLVQVENLRAQINHYLEILRERINKIVDIVGEPVACALTRRLSRNAACLSCAAPAIMKVEESTLPTLPPARPATVGAELPKTKGDGDHAICYPGHAIKHPIDQRAHICNRWCGGSHTLVNNTKSRVPPSVILTPLSPKDIGITQGRGKDGKMYAVHKVRQPCAQCKISEVPEPSPTLGSPVNKPDEKPEESHGFSDVMDIHPAPDASNQGHGEIEDEPPHMQSLVSSHKYTHHGHDDDDT